MLVLSAVSGRDGKVKRFDVVRAEDGTVQEVVSGLPGGDYKVLNGSKVEEVWTGYRSVQDIQIGNTTLTVPAS